MILAACSAERRDEGGDRLQVSVSDGAQAWIASQIAGEDAEVTALIRPGADAETYEPDMATLAALQTSDLYLHTDTEEFERRISAKVAQELPDVRQVNVAEGVELLYGTHGLSHDSRGHGAAGHNGESPDPHLLGSVRNARVVAANICRALSEADTIHRNDYGRRLAQLSLRLDSLDQAFDCVAEMAAEGGAKVRYLVMHPTLSYLARDYGFEQIAIEAEGKEPTPREYARRMEETKRLRPAVYFVEKGSDESRDSEVADMVGARLVEVSLGSADWFGSLSRIAATLGEAQRK